MQITQVCTEGITEDAGVQGLWGGAPHPWSRDPGVQEEGVGDT